MIDLHLLFLVSFFIFQEISEAKNDLRAKGVTVD